MTNQSGGAGIPLTQSVAGVLSGNILTPAFATNGTTAILGTVSALLGSDVTLTTSGVYVDVLSVSLTVGSWLLVGHVQGSIRSSGADHITGKLWDGSTVFDSTQVTNVASALSPMSFVAVITVAAPTTYKVSCVSFNGLSSILAAAPQNGAGNNASHLVALRTA